MATLTLAMDCLPPVGPPGPGWCVGTGAGWCCSGGAGWCCPWGVRGVVLGARVVGPGVVRSGVVLLAVDQLGEPADLAVDRVQAVPLQFEGVAVELLLGAPQRVHEPVALPLDGAPAALEDAQPDVGRGVPEERQVDAEATLVVVGLRAGGADQFVEALLALGGDRVDDLAPAAGQRGGVGGEQCPRRGVVAGDQAS